MHRPLTFLGIAGSLRRASYNRGLIRAAAELAPAGTAVVSYDLADQPLFNADVEALGDPVAVADFTRASDRRGGRLVDRQPGVQPIVSRACSRTPSTRRLGRLAALS